MSPRALVLVAAFVAALAPVARADFEYEDNVATALEAGREALAAGRLDDAVVELENALLMAPGHVGAHEALVQAYAKNGEAALAKKLLKRMRRGRLVGAGRLDELEAMVQGDGGDEGAVRGGLWDGGAPALPPPGAAVPSGTARSFQVATTEDLQELEEVPIGDGLDDLLEDLEEDGEPDTPPDQPASAGRVPDAKDPWAVHAFAVAEYRRTGSALEAGRLLVQALQAAPELLAEPDAGLFDATYKAYDKRLEGDPDNHDARFVLAFLEEKRGENAEAIADYRKVAEGAGKTSRLGKVASARADVLEAEIKRQQAELAAQNAAAAKVATQRSLDAIAQGLADEVKTPEGYREKGRESHKKYQDSNDLFDLEVAAAYYQGAITKEPSNGENHYRFALVKIDMATEGVDGAQDEARTSLEKALALKPEDAIRVDAENLLKALTRR
jgi:DNA-binding SARP family transcriptional activator